MKKLFLAAALVVAVVVALLHHKENVPQVGSISVPQPTLSAIDAHMSTKSDDTWWLDSEFEHHVAGKPLPSGVFERLIRANAQVSRLIDKYAAATPFMEEITSELGRLLGRMLITISRSQTDFLVISSDSKPITQERLETALKLAYIPKQYLAASTEGVRSPVHYSSAARAVVIPAIEWPDIPLAASLFHEMGHAYRHLVSRTGEDGKQDPESLAPEEVEMHMLATAVFDVLTSDAYSAFLQRILARSNIQSVEEVLGLMTVQDWRQLDKALGTEHATKTPEGAVMAQTQLALGFMWIDSHRSADVAAKAKASFYIWYCKPTGK